MSIKQTAVIPDSVMAARKSSPELNLGRWRIAVESMEVNSDEDYRQAAAVLVKIKSSQDSWKSYWERLVGAAKTVYDILRSEQNGPLKELEEIRQKIQTKMAKFKSEQTAKVSRMGASMETATAALRSEMEARAKAYTLQGNMEAAASVHAELELLPDSRIFQYTPPAVEGVVEMDDWEIDIEDPRALLRAISDGSVPLYSTVMKREVALVEFRMSVIKDAIRSQGEAFNWPGIVIREKTSYRVTGSKR